MGAMRISFVRGAPRERDHVYVERDDGTRLDWAWPSGTVPHDLVHLIVEGRMGIARGVWGQVAAGASFPAQPSPPGARRKAEAQGEEGRELLLAEAAVAAATRMMHGIEMTPEACAREVREAAGQHAAALRLSVDDVTSLRDELRALAQRWCALAPRSALIMEWPRGEP
jgi:hypothetical protein